MNEKKKSIDKLIASLQERAKELNCLYRIDEILKDIEEPLDVVFSKIIQSIPAGWQYPDVCEAKISFDNNDYHSPNFVESPWYQSADIIVDESVLGKLSVYYTVEMPPEDEGPFLKEESKLIHTIAEHLGDRIQQRRIRQIIEELESTSQDANGKEKGEWMTILKMIKFTDRNLYGKISRKMLNHLCWSGVAEAEKYARKLNIQSSVVFENITDEWNRPSTTLDMESEVDVGDAVFKIAADNMNDKDTLELLQRWIQEDKLSFLLQVVNRNLPLAEVTDAIRRFHYLDISETEIRSPNLTGIYVSLISRFFSDDLKFVGIAKDLLTINDFYTLLEKTIFSTESQGRLGGKTSGIFLATLILREFAHKDKNMAEIKVPKTWYISTDVLLYFMHHNNFDDVVAQKYKVVDQVRLEYPHIEQSFKNAKFPADIEKGLSMALDDFGTNPIIVRSSSLLEDRADSSFSGKYKSLFLANQGSKRERLDALMDAIAEVYASTFGPDPIEYRSKRGLLDFKEEMGILIQEVVGSKIGRYFLPSFAGVAFCHNEFRWSPMIERDDGLIRLVPGLGTRAVDRLSDDYPVLVAPNKPDLRINVSPEEVVRYSPKHIDVINLEKNCFETISISEMLKEVNYKFKNVKDIVSVLREGHLQKSTAFDIDFDKDKLVVTFDGLISQTHFIKQIKGMLDKLKGVLGFPVDIEFASDGEHLYLLQCRPQSHFAQNVPSSIPQDLPKNKLIFTANRYVSNGRIEDITHIVYVDPRSYENLPDHALMAEVGRAVSRLNKFLPKQQFILIGPGRWGSRGDIRLGVNVTYADISNTSLLVEVAFEKGGYLPDLSFGTHFFQDLVEGNIRYLPLYPDDKDVVFNERFLLGSKNILADVLPGFGHLDNVIHLIDVLKTTGGQVLHILMNSELEKAVGFLGKPKLDIEPVKFEPVEEQQVENHWQWRMQSVKQIASRIDPERFGVVGFYIFGSTKNATAGPASDIDILVHFRGTPEQKENLLLWLEGWSQSLADFNYLRTGYYAEELLDVHIITDEDIEKRTSYAAKIGAATDAARSLKIGDSVSRS
ncbi:MAG: nucleotidyltransferase domain-containing protein [candidate division Zixibacteria bacterium]|nr:nucleotidyltransferase domain-containing protein [candidate division Zixibacteria bacterium]